MKNRIRKLLNALMSPPDEVVWILFGAYCGAAATFTGFMIAITYC